MYLILSSLVIALCLGAISGCELQAETMRFYCGTYTSTLGHVDGKASAIGVYELNGETGEIRLVGQSPKIANTSHMCLGAKGKFLYSISEITTYDGRADGCLTVFAIDDSGNLVETQIVSSGGPGPAYVHLDRSGRFLLLANYVAGNIVAYPISYDGTLEAPTANIQHSGSSVNKDRQESAHPHAIVPSLDNQYVFVPDLGLDRIVAYRFESRGGTLNAYPSSDVRAPSGSGPRHFVFSPDGSRAYCSLELSSELAAYEYKDGELTEVARLSTLPDCFAGQNANAEVRVSDDGRHVYVSNRGHDSIAVFSIVTGNAHIRFVQTVDSEGSTPRNFAISPDGKWIVVANQDSHNLVSLRRDSESGRLLSAGTSAHCPSPAYIRFLSEP